MLCFSVAISAIIINASNAQRCASHLYLNKFLPTNSLPSNKIDFIDKSKVEMPQNIDLLFKIPVVVHVLHNSIGGAIGGVGNWNISNEQILSQIEVLNEDFRKKQGTRGFNNMTVGADVMIEFCLASKDPSGRPSTGIVRKYWGNVPLNVDDYNQVKAAKEFSAWPTDKYLNIWITDIAGTFAGITMYPSGTDLKGLEGFNAEPTVDGMLIDYLNFGRVGQLDPKYNLGRTTTHEMGHWLGLIHIWGDRFCGDDYIDDTPPQAQSSSNLSTNCPQTSSKCSTTTTIDMNNNYMDYSPDICMNIFTELQKARMRKVLETSPRRISIVQNASACSETNSVDAEWSKNYNLSIFLVDKNLYLSSRLPLEDVNVNIYNTNGVLQQKVSLFKTSELEKLEINLPNNGIYFVKVSSKQGIATQKILIE